MKHQFEFRRGLGFAAGLVALVAISVVGVSSLAAAADSGSGSSGSSSTIHPQRQPLSDAQKQCLADQGVTLPAKPADGSRPQITDEQRAALRKAAQACGLPTGPGPRDGGGSAGGSSTSA